MGRLTLKNQLTWHRRQPSLCHLCHLRRLCRRLCRLYLHSGPKNRALATCAILHTSESRRTSTWIFHAIASYRYPFRCAILESSESRQTSTWLLHPISDYRQPGHGWQGSSWQGGQSDRSCGNCACLFWVQNNLLQGGQSDRNYSNRARLFLGSTFSLGVCRCLTSGQTSSLGWYLSQMRQDIL